MKKNSLQELGWALGVMLLPVLYAVWVYQTLPENLAIHFDLSGKGNAGINGRGQRNCSRRRSRTGSGYGIKYSL